MMALVTSAPLEPSSAPATERRKVGRYVLFDKIASGGMATVYLGRLMGEAGFSRTVAIKQLHAQYAESPEFVAQFLDEARLSARIRHPNVVAMLDVVAKRGELFVVMEYIQGEPLSRLFKAVGGALPLAIASAVMTQTLLGLHAAHEATTEQGEPLQLVHRDVSPQNILVGADGVARLLDFGVAKAAARLHTTETGQIKGKLAYMSPEQLSDGALDRRSDVFAAGVVLWEIITGRRLFQRSDPGAVVAAVMNHAFVPPSQLVAGVPPALDQVVERALRAAPAERFASALEMAEALEDAAPPAGATKVAAWLREVAGAQLKLYEQTVRSVEEGSNSHRVDDRGALEQALQESLLHSSPPDRSPVLPNDGVTSRAAPSAFASGSDDRTLEGTVPEAPVVKAASTSRAPLIGFGLALALLLAAVGVRFGSKPAAGFVAQPKLTEAAATPAGSLEAARAPAPEASAAPSVASPESSVASPEPSAASSHARPGLKVSQAVTVGKSPARAAAPKVDCSTPYVLTADGRKRFKPECFR